MIEGDTVKVDAGAAEKKPDLKPKEDGAAETAKPSPAAQKTTDELKALAERRAAVVETILKDLVEAGKGNTRGVLDMYGDQLDQITMDDPDAMERINRRAYAIEAGEYEEGAGK